MSSHRHTSAHQHRYPRSARVNELLREVLAEQLERISYSDETLGILTITGVECQDALRHAKVYLASLSEEAAECLERHRVELQAEVGRQVRMKRTPQLEFLEDPAIVKGERVEAILR